MFGLLSISNVILADTDSALEQRFRNEYPAASQRLEAFYSTCRITAIQESPACKGTQCTTSKTRFEYLRNGSRYRLLARNLQPTDQAPTRADQQAASEQFSGRAGAALIGDEGAFQLDRAGAAEPFVVFKADSRETLVEIVAYSFPPAVAAYYLRELPLALFMRTPQFEIKRASLEGAASEPLARIEWESSVTDPKDGVVRLWGWVLLSPNNGWVIRETCVSVGTAEIPHAHTTTVQIGYEGKLDGSPILKRVSTTRESGPERKKSEPTTWRITTFSREAPLEEFNLATFGVSSK
jgi:hypothetical protein